MNVVCVVVALQSLQAANKEKIRRVNFRNVGEVS